jgi:cytochrome c biogenesis protein CcmG/thiol:disulfide interchange protein DsbE
VLKPVIASCGLALLAATAPVAGRAEFAPELGEVTGQVVWVDFWASWCAPCRRSFPWMNEMLSLYQGRGLQVIGVNVDKEMALAEEFLAETPADFDLRYDPTGQLAERFGVQAMPSSFLLDRDGNVLASHYGFRLTETEEYEAAIAAALAEASRQSRQAE